MTASPYPSPPEAPNAHWMNPQGVADLVSVIVPTHNRATLIEATLDSVRRQTYRPIELIVIDDASSDDTPAVLARWRARLAEAGERLALTTLTQPADTGAPAARNRGLSASRGAFIQFLDSDDLLHPDKLALQLETLRDDPSLDFVYSGTGSFVDTPDWNATAIAGLPQPPDALLARFIDGGRWHTMSGLYRRRACLAIGPWDERVRMYQDHDYNIRLLLTRPRVACRNTLLSLIREHGGARITPTVRSPEILRATRVLYDAWEQRIRAAGAMTPPVAHALAERRFVLAMHALRNGETALARAVLRGGAHLGVAAGQRLRHGAGRCLAACPAPLGPQLARAAFGLTGRRRRQSPLDPAAAAPQHPVRA